MQSNYIEMLRDLMRHFGIGAQGLGASNGKALYEFAINAIRNTMSAYESRGGHLFGNQLADISAMIKFQKNLVEGSDEAAKFIIPFHYADAMRALEPFKLIKNSTLLLEVAQLKSAWEGLKLKCEAMERDDILSKFQGKMA